MTSGDPTTAGRKPSIRQLGIDLADLDWQRSGTGAGSLEVAFVGDRGDRGDRDDRGDRGDRDDRDDRDDGDDRGDGDDRDDRQDGASADWVLLRVAEDPTGRVLVYDRTEWACFLDGVGRGEFG
jgi:hypothetical protein